MKLPAPKISSANAALALLAIVTGVILVYPSRQVSIAKTRTHASSVVAQHCAKQKISFSLKQGEVAVPAPLDEPSEQELKEFPGAHLVESDEIDDPALGQKIRMRVLETHFKYPYVRTEEIIDPATGLLVGRAEMAADHFLLTVPEGENPQDILNALGPEVTSLERVSPNAPLYLARLASPSLAMLPSVLQIIKEWRFSASAEPDQFRQLIDIFSNATFDSNQWALSKIGATDAWKIRNSAASVIVAVIDTGIRYTHEDLKGNMWHNPAPVSGDIYGTNAVAGTSDPMDDCGHGTHCAGIIGATGFQEGVSGIATHVQLMACKYMDAEGKGIVSDEVACLDYATEHGAKIFNCSYGIALGFSDNGFSLTTPFSLFSQAEYDAMERARNKGAIIVAAAGNDGTSNDKFPSYPASYDLDNIVAVAATNDQDQLCDFSNYGAKSVHIAAPGEDILSTWAYSDDSYSFLDGTSMAAPQVAGALALMKAQFPKLSYQKLIDRLLATTDKIPSLEGKTIAGRLNLLQALK